MTDVQLSTMVWPNKSLLWEFCYAALRKPPTAQLLSISKRTNKIFYSADILEGNNNEHSYYWLANIYIFYYRCQWAESWLGFRLLGNLDACSGIYFAVEYHSVFHNYYCVLNYTKGQQRSLTIAST